MGRLDFTQECGFGKAQPARFPHAPFVQSPAARAWLVGQLFGMTCIFTCVVLAEGGECTAAPALAVASALRLRAHLSIAHVLSSRRRPKIQRNFYRVEKWKASASARRVATVRVPKHERAGLNIERSATTQWGCVLASARRHRDSRSKNAQSSGNDDH